MATEKKPETVAEKPETVAETIPDPYELEEIFIPRAGAKEDPNLFVSVNGKNFLIPKGKKSKVPRYIADEIRRSERGTPSRRSWTRLRQPRGRQSKPKGGGNHASLFQYKEQRL